MHDAAEDAYCLTFFFYFKTVATLLLASSGDHTLLCCYWLQLTYGTGQVVQSPY